MSWADIATGLVMIPLLTSCGFAYNSSGIFESESLTLTLIRFVTPSSLDQSTVAQEY
jgi:hypothetical protein